MIDNNDIDLVITKFLNIDYLRNLYQVNKHYNELNQNIIVRFIRFNLIFRCDIFMISITFIYNSLFLKRVRFTHVKISNFI